MQRSIVRYVQPAIKWFCKTRNVQQSTAGSKPIIKIAEDKFQVTVDVRQFSYEELIVKAGQDYVVIEGKQQRKVPNGCLVRQFVRKFRLPEGCDPVKMESRLSDDGFLTVTAYRVVSEPKCNPCDKCINIVRTQNLSDGYISNNTCSDRYPPYNPYEMYLPICKETKCFKSQPSPQPQAPATPPCAPQPPQKKQQ